MDSLKIRKRSLHDYVHHPYKIISTVCLRRNSSKKAVNPSGSTHPLHTSIKSYVSEKSATTQNGDYTQIKVNCRR
jgi:hypothetical protein